MPQLTWTAIIGLCLLGAALLVGLLGCGVALYNLARHGRVDKPGDNPWLDDDMGF